uniref:Uncharacterized protein n=1 Tax=Hyaloperonospora arabidopsidis (strain Emoy2) TaxID=559515 RepID=M4C2S7_HYAAE
MDLSLVHILLKTSMIPGPMRTKTSNRGSVASVPGPGHLVVQCDEKSRRLGRPSGIAMGWFGPLDVKIDRLSKWKSSLVNYAMVKGLLAA